MRIIDALRAKRKIKQNESEWRYLMIFHANNQEFIDHLSQNQRKELIGIEKGKRTKCCAECIFYRNVYMDVDYCGKCTIDKELVVYDLMEKHKDCPLEKEAGS